MNPRRSTGAAIFLLGISVLVACGAGGSTDAQDTPDSGIRGVVLAGPQCPVVTAESPCPDAPWIGTIRVSRGGEVVAEVETADDGRFSIALEPETYEVTAVLDGGPQFAEPRQVSVGAGAYSQVTLTIDTGIR
jgi:hypothetical protein